MRFWRYVKNNENNLSQKNDSSATENEQSDTKLMDKQLDSDEPKDVSKKDEQETSSQSQNEKDESSLTKTPKTTPDSNDNDSLSEDKKEDLQESFQQEEGKHGREGSQSQSTDESQSPQEKETSSSSQSPQSLTPQDLQSLPKQITEHSTLHDERESADNDGSQSMEESLPSQGRQDESSQEDPSTQNSPNNESSESPESQSSNVSSNNMPSMSMPGSPSIQEQEDQSDSSQSSMSQNESSFETPEQSKHSTSTETSSKDAPSAGDSTDKQSDSNEELKKESSSKSQPNDSAEPSEEQPTEQEDKSLNSLETKGEDTKRDSSLGPEGKETKDSTPTDSIETSQERKRESIESTPETSSSKKETQETEDQESSKKKRDKRPSKEPGEELDKEKLEKPERTEATNQFLGQLEELPSFKERSHGGAYSIDTESTSEVPESVIRTLINKFLNQRFCKRVSDLNARSSALERSDGFYKWDLKKVVRHLETEQLTKVLNDKYGYQYAEGKYETVPLSFYFDLSGSMSSYTNLLAVMAIELLKKDVKVLVGFNENVHVQIEKVPLKFSPTELADFLTTAGDWYADEDDYQRKAKGQIQYRMVSKDLDDYLISKKCEKCVVFADCDPMYAVIRLSQKAQVYWFNFEYRFDSNDLQGFQGFVYEVHNLKDIQNGLLKVNQRRFEALTYIDNPKTLRRK